MKNSLLLFLIFFLLRPCNAISRDFTFSNINESFGISMREITAAVRDDDGFYLGCFAFGSPACGIR